VAQPSTKNVCTAVLVTPSGKVPLLRRKKKGGKFDGHYCFPGGTIEVFDEGILREDLEFHASREVEEELGVTVAPEMFSHDGNSILAHFSTRMAISRWIAPWPQDDEIDITKDPDQDHDDVVLVGADDYKARKLIPGIEEYLADLFAVEEVSGTLLAAISSYIQIHSFCFHHESPQFLAIKNTKGKYTIPKTFLTFAQHINNVLLKMLGRLTRQKISA
jgi:8-oxo-dGTP pyrophosphatase MutT (NUDIX family)